MEPGLMYNILYVDDEKSNLRVFKHAFSDEFNIFTAQSGREGLDILDNEEIHLVISDQRMPEMSGTDFFTQAIEKYPDIKYILLTAYTDVEVFEDAINKVGIWKYVNKPYDIEHLSHLMKDGVELRLLALEKKRIENELVTSEKNYRELISGSQLGNIVINSSGDILYVNPAAIELLEAQNEVDIRSKNYNDFYPLSDDEKKTLFTKKTPIPVSEISLSTTEQKAVECLVTQSPISFENQQAALITLQDISKIKEMELALSQEKKKSLQALYLGEENERERIATELHDGLGQLLTAAKLSVTAILNRIPEDEQVHESLSDVGQLLESAKDESQRIAKNLLPQVLLDYGLVAAISKMINEIGSIEDFQFEFDYSEDIPRLDKNEEVMLYRIVQESIQNALKHSKARKIRVNCINLDNQLKLEIIDDGIGFDVNTVKKGNGIENIKQRAISIKASLTINSEPDLGTTISVIY